MAVAAVALLTLAEAEAAPADASAGAAVTCRYIVQESWNGGFFADLDVTNNGPSINGWTVRWTFPQASAMILGTWSSALSETDDGAVTATNLSYNATIGTGDTLAFGWSARGLSTITPNDITINGTPC